MTTFARIRTRFTYANVVSTLALIVALSTGTAYAASLARNSVTSAHIKNRTITSADLRVNAVGWYEIANRSVRANTIAPGAIQPSHLAPATKNLIAQSGGISGLELVSNQGGVTATCPEGKSVLGGGGVTVFSGNHSGDMVISRPGSNDAVNLSGWHFRALSGSSGNSYAICATTTS